MQSSLGIGGVVRLTKVEKLPQRKLTWKEILYWSLPHSDLEPEVFKWRLANFPRMMGELWKYTLMARVSALTDYPWIHGKLFLQHINGRTGHIQNLGLCSLRVVASAGRDEIVDEFDAATAAGFDLTTFNYHGIGTGTNAAAAGDTALQTELTTEYNPNSTRASGTQSQPSSDVYQTVATNTLDSGTPAVTEHGVFSATSAGTLIDRHVFTAKNLDGTAGDGLQSTYQLTIASGG